MKKSLLITICYSVIVLLLASCSAKVTFDDAVRIKQDSAYKYITHPKTKNFRSGAVLRGEVKKVEVVGYPDTCPMTQWVYKNYVVFVDSSVKKRQIIEKIPFEDIDLIGLKINIPQNKYGNINFFENYNDPLLPRHMREVPVDTVYKDTCVTPCNCNPIELDLPEFCLFCIKCPDRELGHYFLELKPGFSLYNDYNAYERKIGRSDWTFDMAFGWRFGKSKRWGIGLIASSGVRTFNKYDTTLTKRFSLNLYLRYELKRDRITKTYDFSFADTTVSKVFTYDTIRTVKDCECPEYGDTLIIIQKIDPNYLVEVKNRQIVEEFEVRPCISPFVYGLFGVNVDKFSIDLMQLNFNNDCKKKLDTKAPDLDISMPLNLGFGVGLEIPITRKIDFSTDLGFRSISYADRVLNLGQIAPTRKRINSLIFRIGITI